MFDEADKKALNDAIAAAVGPLIAAQAETAKNMGIFASTLKELPPAAAAKPGEKKDEAPAVPTIEQINKMLDDRENARKTSDFASAERQKFIDGKLKDLPELYRKQLGTDPAKWSDEEKALRESFKADFKAAGGSVDNVGGNPGGANPVKPGETLDLSKLSEGQLREMAIKALPPVQRAVTPPPAATTQA